MGWGRVSYFHSDVLLGGSLYFIKQPRYAASPHFFFSGNKYNRWLVEETKLYFYLSWALFNLTFQNK